MTQWPEISSVQKVWLRYFFVFKKDLVYGCLTTFAEPILYLLAFGYGMGAMVGTVTVGDNTISYRQFIFAGVVAQAVLFQAFFDAAYGSFVRMYYQKIFKAMATSPLTLSEVLWGELCWDASRATFGATAVLIIGVATGNFPLMGALLTIPVAFLGAFVFAGMGLWASAKSESIESISYPMYLVVFPMFLFCGIYYPLDQLPEIGRIIAWCLPLTSLVHIIRGLTLGLPYPSWAFLSLTLWCVFVVTCSRRAMIRRLIQ